MAQETIRLTMAQALVRWLTQQFTEIEGVRVPLFAGVFGIFGHGNVTCLSEALEAAKETLPTWRGQNEQSMALAAVGFAKAKRRRQLMVAAASIGPGALNMITGRRGYVRRSSRSVCRPSISGISMSRMTRSGFS